MKIDGWKQPKTGFLSMEKDTGILLGAMLSDERLKRLLYYTTPDALDKPNLTEDQTLELVGKNIINVPKLYLDKEVLNYILIHFDNFYETSNPQFRNNVIEFDIICHFDQWQLKDFALRPYKIAAEIDTIFHNKDFTGIGKMQFAGTKIVGVNDEYCGVCMIFTATHGEEDKKFMPNPKDEERFLQDFQHFIKAD